MERRRGWLRFLCCEFSTASNNRAYFHRHARVAGVKNATNLPRSTDPSWIRKRVSVLVPTREGGREYVYKYTESRHASRVFRCTPQASWVERGPPRENKEIGDERGLLFESSHIRLLRRIVSCTKRV